MAARAAFLALVVALCWGLSAAAQGTLDFERWQAVAERAEDAVQAGLASDAVLEDLRAEIADWRTQFLAAETANEARIATLRNQISGLGEAPAEGAPPDPPEIAARRTQLAAQLAQLEAPRQTASEAFGRADGLIAELDTILRERDTQALLTLGPLPINPTLWPDAVEELGGALSGIGQEVERNWQRPAERAAIRQNAPATLGLILIGVALFVRGRRWMERATHFVQTRSGALGQVALGFLVSLGQIVLPVMGLLALSQALLSTGIFGLRGEGFLTAIPSVGFVWYAALWLGARIFPRSDSTVSVLSLPPETRRAGRRYTAMLGALMGLDILLASLLGEGRASVEVTPVLAFPIHVAMGLVLARLGVLILRSPGQSDGAEGNTPEAGFSASVTRLLGRVVIATAVLGPVAAAIGYGTLAAALILPTALSLGLIGALLALHGPIRDLYGLIARKDREATGEALVPVLLSFGVTLASLPLFALIWGMRPSQLGELWARFVAGFSIGETRISPGDVLTVLVVFALGYGATRLVQGALRSTILPRTSLDLGGRNAITSGVGYVGIMLAGLIAITAAGINLSNLAIFASALAVGVGFGLQNIVSNFVSGIILLIERPISEGDWIEVGGQMGYVRNISVRSTRIETFDRTDVIVPNADLVSGTVTNWTRGNLTGRVIVPVGVAYGTDTRRVETILREIAEAHPMVTLTPPPNIFFMGFGADSLDFEIRAILRDVNWLLVVRSDLNHAIAKRFTEEGIEIPFAQRDVWLRNPEALRPASPTS